MTLRNEIFEGLQGARQGMSLVNEGLEAPWRRAYAEEMYKAARREGEWYDATREAQKRGTADAVTRGGAAGSGVIPPPVAASAATPGGGSTPDPAALKPVPTYFPGPTRHRPIYNPYGGLHTGLPLGRGTPPFNPNAPPIYGPLIARAKQGGKINRYQNGGVGDDPADQSMFRGRDDPEDDDPDLILRSLLNRDIGAPDAPPPPPSYPSNREQISRQVGPPPDRISGVGLDYESRAIDDRAAAARGDRALRTSLPPPPAYDDRGQLASQLERRGASDRRMRGIVDRTLRELPSGQAPPPPDLDVYPSAPDYPGSPPPSAQIGQSADVQGVDTGPPSGEWRGLGRKLGPAMDVLHGRDPRIRNLRDFAEVVHGRDPTQRPGRIDEEQLSATAPEARPTPEVSPASSARAARPGPQTLPPNMATADFPVAARDFVDTGTSGPGTGASQQPAPPPGVNSQGGVTGGAPARPAAAPAMQTVPPPRRLPLGDRRRTEAYDPVLDRDDPGNKGFVDAGGRSYSPDEIQQIMQGAISVMKPGANGGPPGLTDNKPVRRETFHQLIAQNSQNGRVPPGEAYLAGMVEQYRTLLQYGQIARANQMALGIMQAATIEAALYGREAQQSIQRGDYSAGLKQIIPALNLLPDGLTFQTPDGRTLVAYNAQTGRETGRQQLTGDQLLTMVMGLSDGTALWRALQQSAAMLSKPDVNAEKRYWDIEHKKAQIDYLKNKGGGKGGGGSGTSPTAAEIAKRVAMLGGQTAATVSQQPQGDTGIDPAAIASDPNFYENTETGG